MNSSRVFWLVWKLPSMALVVTLEFCFSTPRMRMQRCSASSTTRDAERVELLLHGGRDLGGHALLHLEPAREDLDQARDLADADDPLARDVRDVRLAEERQDVVLAEREEIDVAHDDHLGVRLREERAVDDAGADPARIPW